RAGEPAAFPGPRGGPVLHELRRGLSIDPLRRPASAPDLIEGVRAAAQLPPGGSPGGSTHRRSGKTRAARLALALAPPAVAALVTLLAFHPLGIFQHAAASPPSTPAGASGTQQPPLLLIGSGPASCPRGYVCVWERPDYEGRGVAIFGTERDWNAFPSDDGFILDQVQSAFNNGYPDRLPDVAFYPSELYGGSPVIVLNGVRLPDLGSRGHSFRSNRWF
ncbi:MAG TPA: peptidase inhibitor family I36 protein, partial [Actinomycetota bacterium]|nr:peptidase inhibitor family I36 protein [Actinomycetota bacterium]